MENKKSAVATLSSFVSQHLNDPSKLQYLVGMQQEDRSDFVAELDVVLAKIPFSGLENSAKSLYEAIIQWHESDDGHRQTDTYKLSSWQYKHLLSRLLQLDGGLPLVVDLILRNFDRRYESIPGRARELLKGPETIFSSDIVDQHEWDCWLYNNVRQFVQAHRGPNQRGDLLAKPPMICLWTIFRNILDRQRRHACYTKLHVLPQTSRYVYSLVRPFEIREIVVRVIEGRLPNELVDLVGDAHLASTKRPKTNIVPSTPGHCTDSKCCCNHRHSYTSYLMTWNVTHSMYVLAHTSTLGNKFVCDMHEWTCIGLSRVANKGLCLPGFTSAW